MNPDLPFFPIYLEPPAPKCQDIISVTIDPWFQIYVYMYIYIWNWKMIGTYCTHIGEQLLFSVRRLL